jgi:hypothetical protein
MIKILISINIILYICGFFYGFYSTRNLNKFSRGSYNFLEGCLTAMVFCIFIPIVGNLFCASLYGIYYLFKIWCLK